MIASSVALRRLSASVAPTISRALSTGRRDDVYDVVINGGGMVGLALAACTCSHPTTASLRVAVLDREFPPPGPFIPAQYPALRVSTLTPASVQLLDQCGAWQHMEPPRCAPFHDMQVWDAGGGGFVRYDAHAIAQAAMGYVAENSLIAASLARALREVGPHVELLAPAGVASVSLPPYRGGIGGALASVELDDGRRLSARLLVGADGGGSRVRELAGIRTQGRDYRQRGVVATVATAGPPNATAWQRFLPTGPVALLPVRDGRYSNVVWTTTPGMAAQLEAMSPEEFADAVNEALTGGPNHPPKGLLGIFGGGGKFSEGGSALGRGSTSSAAFSDPPRVVTRVGPPPQSFPLVLRLAGKYVRPRVALVGDAAHAVHPLAGQGVNLGFGDVRALAQAVVDAVTSGQDIGDASMLQAAYEGPRRRANGVMAAALDGMQRVFVPQAGMLVGLRNLGLCLVNASPTVKHTIMRYAMFGT